MLNNEQINLLINMEPGTDIKITSIKRGKIITRCGKFKGSAQKIGFIDENGNFFEYESEIKTGIAALCYQFLFCQYGKRAFSTEQSNNIIEIEVI